MVIAPKSPKEQRSFAAHATLDDSSLSDRRDRATGLQSTQPGDGDVDPGQQGRFGGLKQNLTTHWRVQDR